MKKIVIIGNGNWATAIAKVVAENVKRHNLCQNKTDKTNLFDEEVILQVHEETYQNQKLSDYINTFKSNPIYLPNVLLPDNIRANADISCANDADILIICIPHQFINVIKGIKPKKNAFAVNLSKGFLIDGKELLMPSEYIHKILGIDCCCLQGANIANEVAAEKLSECTIGFTNRDQVIWLERMFKNDYFKIQTMQYNKGIEVAGGLKNIISLAIGMASGKDLGSNAIAMIFRKGLIETKSFCDLLKADFLVFEGCCIGDLVSSCIGGRNFKCGIELGKTSQNISEIEGGMCGQKLQGPCTAKTVYEWFKENNISFEKFPLIEAIYRICYCNESIDLIVKVLKN